MSVLERDRSLRVAFEGFWASFDPEDNYFLDVLRLAYREVTPNDGDDRHASSCLEVLLVGPHGSQQRDEGRAVRSPVTIVVAEGRRSPAERSPSELLPLLPLPSWLPFVDWFERHPNDPRLVPPAVLTHRRSRDEIEALLATKDHGCGRAGQARSTALDEMVDALTRHGVAVASPQVALRRCRFGAIASGQPPLEPVAADLLGSLAVGALPIYRSADSSVKHLNSEAMICCRAFRSLEQAARYVRYLDSAAAGRQQLRRMLAEPALPDGQLPAELTPDGVAGRLSDRIEWLARAPRRRVASSSQAKALHRCRAHLINLDRRPDRLAVFRARLPFARPSVERVSAVDGEHLEATAEIRRLTQGNDHGGRSAVIACGMSHYQLWRRIAVEPVSACCLHLIFEDDATFCSDFVLRLDEALEQLPDRVDVVYLGGADDPDSPPITAYRRQHGDLQTRAVPLSASFPAWLSAYAYAITRRGARHLCRWTERHGMPRAIDGVMMDATWRLPGPATPGSSAYLLTPQLCGHADRADSDIQSHAARRRKLG